MIIIPEIVMEERNYGLYRKLIVLLLYSVFHVANTKVHDIKNFSSPAESFILFWKRRTYGFLP